MGKGIAAVFKQLYPDMYTRYRKLCEGGRLDVGMLYIYRTPNKIIVNFPTKRHWRQRSQSEYIEAGLRKFVEHYMDYGISSVSFPQLGCGHGELSWETQVKPLMEHYLHDLPIPVYIHLYPTAPDFVPERLDVGYARQVRLERQRVSLGQLWDDLRTLVGDSFSLTLFGPVVTMNDEQISFGFTTGNTRPVVVYREDVEDIWNTLRLRGTVGRSDVALPTNDSDAVVWLFDLLQRLGYIQPVTLHQKGQHQQGLRYLAQAERQAVQPTEILM